MPETPSRKPIETTVAVVLLLLLFFASPFLDWWSRSGFPWYAPYLFWLCIIILTAIVQRSGKSDV